MCIAVSVKLQVCLEKRLVTAAGLQQIVQDIQMAGKQGHGQRLVAHAWTDPDFKTRLLRDGGAAAAELGISADGVSSKDGIKGTALPAVVCGWKPAAYLQLLPESRTKHCQQGMVDVCSTRVSCWAFQLLTCTTMSVWHAHLDGPLRTMSSLLRVDKGLPTALEGREGL